MKKSDQLFYAMLLCLVLYMIRVALISSPEKNSKETEGQTRKGVAKQRIVSLCKPMPFVIMGLDGNEKRLIGVNAETKIAIQSTILSNYFPNFQHYQVQYVMMLLSRISKS